MLDKKVVKDFMKEHKEVYGQDCWEVGQVVKGSKKAIIKEDIEIINIKESFIRD